MDRIKRLAGELPEDLDAAFINSAVNRRYYTGFNSSAGVLLVTRDDATIFLDSRYIEVGIRTITDAHVVLMGDLTSQLNEYFEEHHVKTVGIESGYMTVEKLFSLRKVLNVELKDDPRLNYIILNQRRVKTPDEMEQIRAAQAITDQTFLHMLEQIRPGLSEKDLQLELDFHMLKHGATGLAFETILAAGANGSMPHAVPGTNVIKEGDFVTMDFGASVNGYCSDMTRTVAVGKITEEQESVYELVLRAQTAAEAAVRAGIPCDEIDAVARDMIYGAGYEGKFGHGLGHSLGLEIHEDPRFSPTCSDVTVPGLVMSVEPGIYLEGRFGVRIEDIVQVTEDGCDVITRSEKKLIRL
ncbi:MAG TPA: aminopeptidase P family protein [Oscillospiraceae bacterium]|nr:aminopeptidase P family protein [Oscillospiraceae bacterium]HRW56975.1 aminopeptidase P family protein [Oscillospiraceae bacterium]